MQRLDSIDRMKGFALLLVTMGHIYIPNTVEGHDTPVCQMIYSFHMAFFFFLSGFMLSLTHGVETKGARHFLIRKMQTLLLPWLSFTLVVLPLLHRGISLPPLSVLNFYPVGTYWFLPLLFIFMIVWLCVYQGMKKVESLQMLKDVNGGGKNTILKNSPYFMIALMAAFAGMALHLYHIIVWAIYFVAFIMGYYVSKYDGMRNFIEKKTVCGLVAILLVVAWKLGPIEANGVAWKSMLNLCYTFTCSITASIVLFNILQTIKLPALLDRFMCNTGKLSIAVYLIPIALLPHTFKFPEQWNAALVNLSVVSVAIVINYLCWLIGSVILEIPYIRFFLFGKK